MAAGSFLTVDEAVGDRNMEKQILRGLWGSGIWRHRSTDLRAPKRTRQYRVDMVIACSVPQATFIHEIA
jgi:hypothetical protein